MSDQLPNEPAPESSEALENDSTASLSSDEPVSDDEDPSWDDYEAGMDAYDRYKETWDVSYLDTAVAAFQRAVNVAAEPDAILLGWLGLSLSRRYETSGSLDDLERALAAQQHALEFIPEEHPDRALRLNNMASSMLQHFERLGELDDLEHAIVMTHRAVEITPDGHPAKPTRLNKLGSSLRIRFERLGGLDDLEQAIAAQRRAVDLAPDGHPSKPAGLSNLGISLCLRFEHLGGLDDLEQAIAAHRRAVELTPDGPPEKPKWLNSLGASLQSRFERLGELDDLEQAIATERRADELTSDGHPDKPITLSNLGVSLQSRFERLGELDDLEQAIVVHRCAVELTPDGHPTKAAGLNNLGHSLQRRFERLGELDDLEQAIAVHRRAVELTPDGHPTKAAGLSILGHSLQSRFERLGELDDLEQAIAAKRRALELISDGHPDTPTYLGQLGDSLMVQLRQEKTKLNFEEALTCFMTASSHLVGFSSQHVRLITAQRAVLLLNNYPEFSTPERMLSAHSLIIDILPEIVWLGHGMKRRFEESSQLGTLVNAAVCTAIGAGALSQAVEWLEAGRTLIWSQVLSLRSPLDNLREHYPELACRFQTLQGQLQSSVHSTFVPESVTARNSEDLPTLTTNAEADHHRGLAIQYGHVLAEVRRQPEFEDFMRSKKLLALLPSSTESSGPIVFLNTSPTRCDAVLLIPSASARIKASTLHAGWKLRSVRLSGLTERNAGRLHSLWQRCIRECGERKRAAALGRSEEDGTLKDLKRVLARLWDWVVHPILKFLHLLNTRTTDHLPHITWCPTGPLMQLPLHAAGIYDSERGARVYNYVVSSYTPSLSALLRCQQGLDDQRSPSKTLVVTQPATPGQPSLPGILSESARLRDILPAETSTFLDHDKATMAAVLDAIDETSWIHLACHGSQNPQDPSRSAFHLFDGPLTLSQLMGKTADGAELAFLSACQTATGDEMMPEESMHLAASMLAVGFKGVVATMWSIGDEDAPIVVGEYYKRLLEIRGVSGFQKGQTGAAYALHEAVKCLREQVGEESFVRWAPFVHFGV